MTIFDNIAYGLKLKKFPERYHSKVSRPQAGQLTAEKRYRAIVGRATAARRLARRWS